MNIYLCHHWSPDKSFDSADYCITELGLCHQLDIIQEQMYSIKTALW